jgi:Zn-dependent M28 family amino/carboxypeptidase
VVSAHYDSVPDCAGADDNASGVAGVLIAAKVLAAVQFKKTLVVACWDEEEAGLIGSKAWVSEAKASATDVRIAFVFEMIGYRSDQPDSQRLPNGIDLVFPDQAAQVADNQNRGDFLAVVADDAAHAAADSLVAHAKGLALPTVWLELSADLKNSPLAHTLRRSDHASFWKAEYPAMMLTDTSEYRNAHYHCTEGEDSMETLDLDFATKVVAATVGAAADSLEIAPE